MKPEIKEKWVAALRSGDYKQGTGVLRTEQNEFCCLGVLCDIHAKETKTEWKQEESGHNFYLGENGLLPNDVMKWAEISENRGRELIVRKPDASQDPHRLSDVNDDYIEITCLNDGKNGYDIHTFNELADIIEAQL